MNTPPRNTHNFTNTPLPTLPTYTQPNQQPIVRLRDLTLEDKFKVLVVVFLYIVLARILLCIIISMIYLGIVVHTFYLHQQLRYDV